MKTIYGATALAALAGLAAAKDQQTFSVLRFNGMVTQGRMDPIVSPGEDSQHVHGVLGGIGFHKSATKDDLMNSECTSAKVQGDNSAYWFPTLYFKDPNNDEVESVNMYYANVYYFFDATDDEIKAFPAGLKMVAGDAMRRVVPDTGANMNLDPSKGPISNVQWTCPRLNNVFDPPSWVPDSDGSMAGIGSSDPQSGIGFPDRACDGMYSPLRADVHFPSCYNPDVGLDNYAENMDWPTDAGNWKVNCPEGWIHVPHIFLEVYWDTPAFNDRWEPGSGVQPFMLSNGDATGYSSHGDFFAGWDEPTLQNIIDNCNTGHDGMHTCPGVTPNDAPCVKPSEVDEPIDGVLPKLPGDNPYRGWAYGVDDAPSTSVHSESAVPESTAVPTAEPTPTPLPTSDMSGSTLRRSATHRRHHHLHARQHLHTHRHHL